MIWGPAYPMARPTNHNWKLIFFTGCKCRSGVEIAGSDRFILNFVRQRKIGSHESSFSLFFLAWLWTEIVKKKNEKCTRLEQMAIDGAVATRCVRGVAMHVVALIATFFCSSVFAAPFRHFFVRSCSANELLCPHTSPNTKVSKLGRNSSFVDKDDE